MYNDPYDTNQKNNTNDPLRQNNENEGNAPQEASTQSSAEYHYTADQVKERAPETGAAGQDGASYGGQGQQTPYPTQTGWQYGSQSQSTYTWNGSPQQNNVPYYTPAQPPKAKKPRDGKKAKKFALRAVAAVLCCAMVSFASVGIFAALIQTGVVNVESTGSGKTAAFTLYKNADSGEDTSNVVSADSVTRQEAAQKVIPSVVCIQNYQITTQGFFFNNSAGDSNSAGSLAGEGSGIIISEDGYIVTNQHVIDGASKLEVVTSDGASYEATLVGEDTQTDLAVIKIEATGLTAAEFAASSDLQVGDEVMAVGNPGGLQLSSSVTFGYVSALNRPVTNSETGYTVNCIQTDAAINPGNSGGPLFDLRGNVVGVTTAKYSGETVTGATIEGIGFAIPINDVREILSELREYGRVPNRAQLGVMVGTVYSTNTARNGRVQVRDVTEDSAGAHAGLRDGDFILALDDYTVRTLSDLSAALRHYRGGDHATLTIERYGKTFRLPIVFDSKDDAVQNEEPTTSANALEPSEQDSPRP